MPTSDKQGKLISRLLIEHHDPHEIWDIGAGEGTYADLMKYTALSENSYWVGVEIWEPYIRHFNLESKYHEVMNLDIRNIVSFPGLRPNLIIFGDVLEHMPEDDARQVILRAKQHFRWILVSLPIVHSPQGEVNGNPYEAHLKHWTFDEMHEIMGRCMAFKGSTLGVFWWDAEEDI
jgi:hypothetical protein